MGNLTHKTVTDPESATGYFECLNGADKIAKDEYPMDCTIKVNDVARENGYKVPAGKGTTASWKKFSFPKIIIDKCTEDFTKLFCIGNQCLCYPRKATTSTDKVLFKQGSGRMNRFVGRMYDHVWMFYNKKEHGCRKYFSDTMEGEV